MVSIRQPSNSGSKSTKDTAFIQFFDGQKPQIHEFCSLSLDNITGKVHRTSIVEVITGTVGEFWTDYLAENGRRIPIIGKLYVNNSVQFLVFPAQAWGCGLLILCNLNAHPEATGW